MGENDNNVVDIQNDEQADQALEIPSVELKEGEETVQVPAAVIKQLTQTAKTALAQKKHWRGKAVDPVTGIPYKDIASKGKQDNAPHSTSEPSALEKDVAGLKLSEEKRQFGHANSLSPEETDAAFALAAGLGKKPSDVLDHPLFKGGLESMRRTARNAGATPGPSGRAPVVVEGKAFKDMTPEERQKNFGAVVAGATGRQQ